MKTATRTAGLMSSNEPAALPDEIQLIPFGAHETEKGHFTLDAEGMAEVMKDFQARSNDMVIDYEHQSLSGEEAPAAGWIKRLIDKGRDGIWASVEWTPRAKEYLKNREYRYLSPVFLKRTSDNRVVRLLGAALTNIPAIDGMVPVINKNQGGHVGGTESPMRPRKEGKVMTKLLSALGLSAGTSEEEAMKALEALKAKGARAASPEVLAELGLKSDATASEVAGAVAAMKQAASALAAVQAEVAELRARLSKKEAEETVALAMKEGKLTPAQHEWAISYAERDLNGFKTFIARAPVVVPRGEIQALSTPAHSGIADSLQFSVNKLLMVSDETFRKFSKKED